MGGLTLGPFSLLSHPITLALPSAFTALFLVIRGQLFTGIINQHFVFVVVFIFTSIFSVVFGAFANTNSWFFFAFSVIPLFLFTLRIGRLFELFFFVYVVVSLFSMSAWIIGYGLFLTDTLGRWKISGMASSANLLATHLNMLWPLGLYFTEKYQFDKVKRGIMYALVLLALLAVFLTFSRAASGIGFSLVVLFLIRRNPGFLALFVGIGSIFCYFYFWNDLLDLLGMYRFIGFQSSFPRTLIWEIALESIIKYPLFGTSPGGAQIALSNIDMYHAHNNYIHVLLEYGIPVAIMFAIATAWIASRAYLCIKRGGIFIYPAGSILAYLASSMVATPFSRPSLTITLAFIFIYVSDVIRHQFVLRSNQNRTFS